MDWILDRLKERSTWVGIVAGLGSLGVVFDVAQQEAIIALGLAIIGAIFAFTKDKA